MSLQEEVAAHGAAWVTDPVGQVAVLVLAYGLCLGLSGVIVRGLTARLVDDPSPAGGVPGDDEPDGEPDGERAAEPAAGARPRRRFNSHTLIGKCENFLVVSFVLSGELTGLALIFAAKSLVRTDAIHRDPGYYLGGTLVNLCWSILVGMLARLALVGPLA